MCTLCQARAPETDNYEFHTDPVPLPPELGGEVSARTDMSGDSITVQSGGSSGGRPVYSIDQIADYLTDGYWSDNFSSSRSFSLGPDRTLDVNITGLTSAGKTLARAALETWTDVSGIRFREVSFNADITFDDEKSGAYAQASFSWSSGYRSNINISKFDWLPNFGTSLTSYSFQTYIHEIGHALGLGHAGNYNGFARYWSDADYANDSVQASIMSYFDVSENTFVDANFDNVLTPQMADILAIQNIYGVPTNARSGNTTYGTNATPDANVNILDRHAVTIFDSSGIDTIDLTSSNSNQRLDLNEETFSDINGWTGNLGIARRAEIENADLGSGADVVIGNHLANIIDGGGGSDWISGGGGNDIVRGGSGSDTAAFSGDRDDYVIVKLSDSDYGYKVVDKRGGVSDGADLLSSVSQLSFGDGQVSLSSVDALGLQAIDTIGDYNGDGTDDVLWRKSDGSVGLWLMDDVARTYSFVADVSSSWAIKGSGDLNGDGTDDVFWRKTDGSIGYWEMNNGQRDYEFIASISADWKSMGIGDFNGDGTDDILWRRDDGKVGMWEMQNGSRYYKDLATVSLNWLIVDTGDFNGDGTDDILWRREDGKVGMWSMNNGQQSYQDIARVDLNWSISGTGDFNGDGTDDILWRRDDGKVGVWSMNDGQRAYQDVASVGLNWEITGTGDFNDDGTDDVLWRRDDGRVGAWTMDNNTRDYDAIANVGLEWDIVEVQQDDWYV